MPHTEGYQLRSLLDEAWCMSNDSLGVDPFTEQRYSRFLDELRNRGQTVLSLIAAAPEMLEMLEELEWRYPIPGTMISVDNAVCLMCSARRPEEHTPDCRLAALLKKARGEDA